MAPLSKEFYLDNQEITVDKAFSLHRRNFPHFFQKLKLKFKTKKVTFKIFINH
jgi:lipopolysaccharide export system protein LptC